VGMLNELGKVLRICLWDGHLTDFTNGMALSCDEFPYEGTRSEAGYMSATELDQGPEW